MSENNSAYQKLANTLPIALAFLMPIFFLPTSTEFFEFNKQFLLVIATAVLLGVWAVKLLSGERFEIARSVLDLPFLALIFVMSLATIFAVNKTVSVYGSPGRWFPSLFGYASLVVFYYLISSGIKSLNVINKTLNAFLIATFISTTVSLLSYFGVFLGSAPFLRISNFTLTGSITTTTVLAALAIVISLGKIGHVKKAATRTMLLVAMILNFMIIALTGEVVGWIVLGVGVVATIAIVGSKTLLRSRTTLTMFLGAVTAIAIVVLVPATREGIINENYRKEVRLPVRESWVITSSVIRDYPLLATGPSSFYLNFPRYRTALLNSGPLWNIRFDKPANEILNVISTTGLIGLLAMIFLGYRVYKLVVASTRVRDEEGYVKILAATVITAASIFFVTYASVLNSFLMFLFLALLVAAHASKNNTKVVEVMKVNLKGNVISSISIGDDGTSKSYLRYIIGVPCLALSMYAGYALVNNYMGEFYARRAVVAAQNNDWEGVYGYQIKAIQSNPSRDVYYTRYAQTSIALANNIAAKESLSEEDKMAIQTLISKAIQSSKAATESVNPLDVRNWETRAGVYRKVSQATEGALEWSIASYNIALQLDPTNPRLWLDLGGLYYAKGDYLAAANQFRQATLLKPNYANAYYNLGQSLVKLGDYQNAKLSFEKTKLLVARGSEDYIILENDIARIDQELEQVAGAATQKPSIESVESAGAAQETDEETKAEEPQEPLTNVGEEEPANAENIDEDTLVETTTESDSEPTPTENSEE
jgi:tetratricopeptide (TPR) repeat protein